MTGSNAVLIAVPVVALATLAFWLGLVYYAGAHPEWKVHRLQREARAREAQARELAAAVTADQAAMPDRGQAAGAPGLGQAAQGRPAGPGAGARPGSPRARPERHAAQGPGGGQPGRRGGRQEDRL